jgi:hypothetical protein
MSGGKRRGNRHNKKSSKDKQNKDKQSKPKEISFKNLQCSPNPDPEKTKDYTCLDDQTLLKLKDLWNARHPDVKIESKLPKEIWIQLKEYLKSICNKESCWLKQNFVEGKLDTELRDSFAPKSPADWKKNPNEWLSSVDILDVMKQYEKAYKCFDFIGPTPIDFDTRKMYGECVWEELCNFNLAEQIKANTERFEKRFKKLLSLSRAYGAKPICVSQPHLYTKNFNGHKKGLAVAFRYEGVEYNGLDFEASIAALNASMKALCLENDGFFIDIAAKKFIKDDFYDAVHMTASGSKRLAEYLLNEFLLHKIY